MVIIDLSSQNMLIKQRDGYEKEGIAYCKKISGNVLQKNTTSLGLDYLWKNIIHWMV